jgi:predicted N-acetyltransferase YhbS
VRVRRTVEIRGLQRDEIANVWSIDRAEVIEGIYRLRGGELALERVHHDVPGWPPGEPAHYGPLLLDCVDHGGVAYGAFDGGELIGAAVVESRFIGRANDTIQLKFLHVSRRARGKGVGVALFAKAAARARALGARRLYVSSTESEHTVQFYLRRGCRLAEEVDAALFALEPADIHLALELPATPG